MACTALYGKRKDGSSYFLVRGHVEAVLSTTSCILGCSFGRSQGQLVPVSAILAGAVLSKLWRACRFDLCAEYMSSQTCKMGERCHFAHGVRDLRCAHFP